MRPVRDVIKRDERPKSGKKQKKFQKPVGPNADRKKVNPGPDFLHGTEAAKNGNQPANTRRRADDRNVHMARQHCEQYLQNPAHHARKQIEAHEFASTERFLHPSPKEIKTETVEQNMPWPGRGMQELKRDQLPNSAMQQSVTRQSEVMVDV